MPVPESLCLTGRGAVDEGAGFLGGSDSQGWANCWWWGVGYMQVRYRVRAASNQAKHGSGCQVNNAKRRTSKQDNAMNDRSPQPARCKLSKMTRKGWRREGECVWEGGSRGVI